MACLARELLIEERSVMQVHSPDWSNPPDEPHVEKQYIHVWRASLDCEVAVLRHLETVLTPDEKSRAARFIFARDRDHFIVARGILRTLLGAYLQRPATDVEFLHGPQNKPAIHSDSPQPPIHFNLSHSHGLVIYAIGQQREVGIDLEMIQPAFAGEEIAERFFSSQELAELHSLPPQLRANGFFLCWTRKEAYVKARGAGMGIPLDSFDVSLTPGKPAELWSTDSRRWSLRSLQPADGYVGALVGEGQGWGVRLWDWRPRENSMMQGHHPALR
jgi:4'-phosphopantetheinyl transferase